MARAARPGQRRSRFRILKDAPIAETRNRAEGFGIELYDNYAPDVFKKAFWAWSIARGKNFHTIQIYSDKPDIPWELMKPVRENGTGRQDFLGLDYSVARWHMTDGLMRERPPFTLRPYKKCL